MYNIFNRANIEVKMPITAQTAQQWSEQGYVPDRVIRLGIQRLLAERLIEIQHNDCEAIAEDE